MRADAFLGEKYVLDSKKIQYFTKGELALWGASVGMILLSFCLFDRESILTLAASLIGVTSLIFCAKGNPIGQVLMVLFSLLYGIISLSFAYYGEMITYLCMTMPIMKIGCRNRAARHYFDAKSLIWKQIFAGQSGCFLKIRAKICRSSFK